MIVEEENIQTRRLVPWDRNAGNERMCREQARIIARICGLDERRRSGCTHQSL